MILKGFGFNRIVRNNFAKFVSFGNFGDQHLSENCVLEFCDIQRILCNGHDI